jgi:hypothetical protein
MQTIVKYQSIVVYKDWKVVVVLWDRRQYLRFKDFEIFHVSLSPNPAPFIEKDIECRMHHIILSVGRNSSNILIIRIRIAINIEGDSVPVL